MIYCSTAFLSPSLQFWHVHFFLGSVILYSLYKFSHVATQSNSTFVWTFSFRSFSFIYSKYFSFLPLLREMQFFVIMVKYSHVSFKGFIICFYKYFIGNVIWSTCFISFKTFCVYKLKSQGQVSCLKGKSRGWVLRAKLESYWPK